MDPSLVERFAALVRAAQACRRCPAMEGRRRVLSRLNGPSDARVLFIAEAPGRLGGEITGVPLSHDQTGQHFNRLLPLSGLSRDQVFITNAVLCNPRTALGTNRPPTPAEIAACSGWLRQQIALLNPAVIVTLGVVALRALAQLEPHPYTLRRHVAQPLSWAGRTLVPLYHPSPRTRLRRPAAQQEEDFRTLGTIVGRALRPVPTMPEPVAGALLDGRRRTTLLVHERTNPARPGSP